MIISAVYLIRHEVLSNRCYDYFVALKATIYKINLQVANMDTHYYEQHSLTLAKHPSETDERLMVRLLTFALYANEALMFGKDISEDNDPTLWIKDLTGAVDLWIEIGQPDERTLRKACNHAKQVVLVLYGAQTDLWWKHHQRELVQKSNLTVLQLPYKETQAMAAIAQRGMDLTCNIEAGQVMLMSDETTINIEPVILHPSRET